MPYIDQESRRKLHCGWLHSSQSPVSAGELNYVITTMLIQYLYHMGDGQTSYQRINDCVGALECAKLELYRRVVSPYEDKKCKENGDVYT